MTHSSNLIKKKKVFIARFYDKEKEVNQIETNQDYVIDLLTYQLEKTDRIYLVKQAFPLGTEITIQVNDIPLNIFQNSNNITIPHRLANKQFITYLSSVFNISLNDKFQYYYSNLKFNTKQIGNFWFCVQHSETRKYCVHQGVHDYLNFIVLNKKPKLWIIIIITLFALFLSALTSGLTLGIMSLDTHELQVLIKTGNKEEQNAATKIYPLRKKGNFLLCTLVIANTVFESMLNYMVSFLVQGPFVIVVSTVFLVIFGQILPLAFSTRYGLALGSSTIYVTYFFIVIFSPVAYPLAIILDKCLGEETPTVYDKERLIEYIKLTRPINKLGKDQLDMISGVVYLRDKTVGQAMTKLKDVFMISIDMVLTTANIKKIFKKGFSRIPVYKERRDKIVSILFLKDLVLLYKPITVKELVQKTNHYLAFTDENQKINKIFYYMKKGKTHMIIVRKSLDPSLNVTGIITLEDIIEEILQTQINDESDYKYDVKNKKNLLQLKS